MRNPFADDIFSGAESGSEETAAVFQSGALEALEQTVPETGGAMGRALVVTAPRAGFGKSHLVSRFAQGLAGRALVVPLTFDLESPPRWAGVLWEVVEKLHRDHGHRSGLTLLDETSRFLFARVNQRLIENGQIPCTHPTEAVAALDRNYMEMFDFTNPGQVVARWFGEHFERLVPLTSAGLAPEARVEPDSVAHWLRVLVAYAQGAGELPSRRLEALKWAVHTSGGAALGGGGGPVIIQDSASPEQAAKDKLRDLGRLLGLYRPLVFVIDHLDAFYRDGAAGLRIAYFVSELRRLLPRSLSVVCVNQDVWQATFQSQLPSALEDRLGGGFVALHGVTRDQAVELVEARMLAAGLAAAERESFAARLGLDAFMAAQGGRPVSPRAVLRHAAMCWDRRSWSSLPGGAPVTAAAGPVVPLVPVPPTMVLVPGADSAGGAGMPEAAGATAPASSVVGEETLDSISAALQAMVSGEGPAAAALAAGPASGSFQRLREKLDRLRPVAGVEPGVARPPVVEPEAVAGGPGASGPLAGAFAAQLQRRLESPAAPALDLERLGRLLRFAGEHFPVVRAAELGVPGTSGTAVQWLSPDAEILIGLESSTRPIFWSALTAHGAARLRVNGGLPVKIVAFTEPGAGLHPAEQGRAAGAYTLDLVAPTPGELNQLAAACDVLDEVEAGRLAAEDQDLATLLAQELEPFWRRLTRLASARPA
jgi:hypothetical protein